MSRCKAYFVADRSFVLEQCCNCGVEFLMPEMLYIKAKEDRGPKGRRFYCPNGHDQYYVGETDAERERRRAERAIQENARLQEEIDAERRKTAAAKGALTKHKKRAAAGTCPCCNRTFQNVATHMKRQHPEFVEEQGAKVIPIDPRRIA